jgi:hypothetical protein
MHRIDHLGEYEEIRWGKFQRNVATDDMNTPIDATEAMI